MNVSVAMTSYNGANFIEEQIKSILNQTYKVDQLVICDDNSNDNTFDILTEYSKKYPDIIEIYQNSSNLGVTKNFEKAIQLCDGYLTLISDQDDIWKENKIERQLTAYRNNDKSLICHNSTITTDHLEPVDDLWSRNEYQSGIARDPQEGFKRLVLDYNFIQGSTMMFDETIKENILPIPEVWQYDYFIALVSSMIGGIYDIDEELLLYRQHEDQDLGLPKNTFVNRFLHSVNKFDYEHIRDVAEGWEIIQNRVYEFSNHNMNIPKEWALDLLAKRVCYDKMRVQARNPSETYSSRSQAIYKNIYKKYYWIFGYGMLSAGRDGASMVIERFPNDS